jgi:hypothetical protein
MTRKPRQLSLIDVRPEWRLDPETREIGRRGIASARAALTRTQPAPPVTNRGRGQPDDRRAQPSAA